MQRFNLLRVHTNHRGYGQTVHFEPLNSSLRIIRWMIGNDLRRFALRDAAKDALLYARCRISGRGLTLIRIA